MQPDVRSEFGEDRRRVTVGAARTVEAVHPGTADRELERAEFGLTQAVEVLDQRAERVPVSDHKDDRTRRQAISGPFRVVNGL
jgi:hypothetical protein